VISFFTFRCLAMESNAGSRAIVRRSADRSNALPCAFPSSNRT
jgi:hypothetical protein